jgi:hypothetical protein
MKITRKPPPMTFGESVTAKMAEVNAVFAEMKERNADTSKMLDRLILDLRTRLQKRTAQ